MMDADLLQYSFDVFSFDGDRWSLASSFSMTQKDDALRFAQRMYSRPQIKGVRIIQETFDRDRGGSSRRPLLVRVKDNDVAAESVLSTLEPKLA